MSIYPSPLEQFEVLSLVGLNAPLFGYLNFTLTNLALYTELDLALYSPNKQLPISPPHLRTLYNLEF